MAPKNSRRSGKRNRNKTSQRPSWQSAVDSHASAINPMTGRGHSIGQNWYNANADLFSGVSAQEVAQYAASKGYGLGNAWAQYGQTDWQQVVDAQASQGTVGQAWYDATGASLGVSAQDIYDYAAGNNYTLGQQWGGPQQQQPQQEFDWQSWNSQMESQQAAVWESMDAINSEFLRQQEAYLEQERNRPRRGPIFGGSYGGSADPGMVRRKKRKKSKSGIKTNTGLGVNSSGGAGGAGVSLGGGGGGARNGLSIGKS